MNSVDEVKFLDNQHPASYIRGTWYPAETKSGNKVEIRRTKPGFLRIRQIRPYILKSYTGEVLRKSMEYVFYRANTITGKVVEL